ncbi:MAG TPA: D-alanyl-D-alanine carboxypeptidase family protein [Pyrinomonadaceae bacterium]|nr:D-alanyl-D-alanine carboxypeptidase family protein [Pyrinomonadaceae bacterium]
MKRFGVQIFTIFVATGVLLGIAFFNVCASRKSYEPGDRAAVENAAPTVGAAAARNAQLRTELKWLFGGKPQRGWYLYTALISRLLDTKRDPGSDEFAKALARWQKKSGLTPSGVLDDTSFYKIIAEWQSRRLKDRTPAQPQQLITAPSSDFYDPERLDELRQVERETYAAYKRMVAAAIGDKSMGLAHVNKKELARSEKYLKIISSYRSREYQEKLRRESPNAGSAGLAVNSPHFTGRALDLYVGGEPVETNDPNRAIQVQTRVYQWLVKNAGRYGFQPYFYEPWHWEYVGRK